LVFPVLFVALRWQPASVKKKVRKATQPPKKLQDGASDDYASQ